MRKRFIFSIVVVALAGLISCKKTRETKSVIPAGYPEVEQVFLRGLELYALDQGDLRP